MPRITPNLWFDTESEEAAEFYVSVFPNSKITNVTHYGEAGPREAGMVLTVDFVLDGQEYTAINGGPEFTFDEAISLLDQLRRPGRGRLLLGEAGRGRRGRPVRLAEGPVRPLVAGLPRRHAGDAERPRPGRAPARHEGDARHEEARPRRAVGGRRPGLSLARCGLLPAPARLERRRATAWPKPSDEEGEVEQSTHPRTAIPAVELEARRERLLEHARREGLSGYVLFDAHYIQYFTGFGFLSTERPVVMAQSARVSMAVFVPEFEVERVRAETAFERIESYPEYPGIEHPMRILARVLADLGVQGAIGADQDGYPGILGYQGPPLSEAAASSVAPLGTLIERMMARKSASEIALIRESARWCEHAHRLLQEYSRPGATEAEASLRAGHEATLAMLQARGEVGGSRARPTARRPATGARSACAARGRTRSPTTSSSRPATCSSPRRARRSGATRPSSSGR